MTRLTLEDLAPVAEILQAHGFQRIALERAPVLYAWQGVTEMGRGAGLAGEDRRVVITSEGTLIVREPGVQVAWRQSRIVECGDDTAAMVDELVNAGLLSPEWHTAYAAGEASMLASVAGLADVAAEARYEPRLTPDGLAALDEGVASGA